MSQLKSNRNGWDLFLGIVLFVILVRGLAQFLYSYNSSFLPILHASSLTLFFLVGLSFILFVKSGFVPVSIVAVVASYNLFFMLISIRFQYFEVGDYLTYIFPVFMAVLCSSVLKYKSYKHIYFLVVLLFLIQLAIVLRKYGIEGILSRQSRGELGSLFGHANSFGLILTVFFIGLVFTYFERWRIPLILSVFIISIFVGARSMIIAMIFMYLFYMARSLFKREFVYLVVFVFVGLMFSIVMYGYSLHEVEWTEQSMTSGNSLRWRLLHWNYYLMDLDSISNWLIGFGVGAHSSVTENVYATYYEVHNDFIRMIYDFGLVGLTLYLFLDYLIIKKFLFRYSSTMVVGMFMTKYFFMFFDNMVTNMMTIVGFYLVVFKFYGGDAYEKHSNYS